MSDQSRATTVALPPALPLRLEQVCDRFEVLWKAGQHPHLEDYLADVPEAERPAYLHALIPLEVAYRRGRGEAPRAEEYQARFPALAPAWLAAVCALRPVGAAGDDALP